MTPPVKTNLLRLSLLVLVGIILFSVASFAGHPNTAEGKAKALLQKAHAAKTEPEITAALKALREYTPATEGDIQALSQDMESNLAPVVQKVILKAANPNLVPALIKVTEEKWQAVQPIKAQDIARLSEKEKEDQIRHRASLEILIEVLGRHKDRRAIPILKEMLDDEILSYQASTVLSHIGDESVFNELKDRLEHQKEISLANIHSSRLKEIVEEIDDPATSKEKRGRLIGEIKGSKDPEVNKILKDLALNHQNPDVRSQAGMALVNSIIMDPSVGDPDFIIRWAGMESSKDDWDKEFIPDAMNKAWNPVFIPALIKLLKSPSFSLRENAMRVLGEHKAVEAVPYLEEVLKNDKEDSVRVSACGTLRMITGREYFVEVYESDFRRGSPDLERIKRGELPYYKIMGKERP